MPAIRKAASRRKKPASPKRQPPAAGRATSKMTMHRKDYGAPVDAYYAKQGPPLGAVVLALRDLLEKSVPDATAALKWSVPVYAVAGRNFAGIARHKAHVNLVLWGEPGTFDDPRGLLVGDGPSGRVLRLTGAADLPRTDVRRWLKAAAQRAREKAKPRPA